MDRHIDRNPSGDSAYDYIKMSFELKNMKLYKEAVEMLYKALGCEDISDKTTEIVSQIGDLYLLLKNYERAIDQYEKALDAEGTHTHSLKKLCEIYFIKNDFEKALSLIKELCEKEPEVENFISYFSILLKLNMHDEMTQLYGGLSEVLKKNDKILYMLSRGDVQNKEKYLKEVIEVNPDFSEAQLDLGIIYFEKGDYKDAQECFKSVIEADPKCAAAYYFSGLIHQEFKKPNKAIEQFINAVKLEPQNEKYFFDLSKVYTDVAWYDEAQTAAAEALRILRVKNPNANFNAHYFLLAWIYIQKRDFKGATMSLDLITADSNIREDVEILKCVIALEEGDVASAKTGLEECCARDEHNKENPILLSALGRVYKELKMYDAAVCIYENALKIYPASFEYASELIDLLIDIKDYDRAMEFTQDFKELNPTSTGVYNSMARIYYRQGKLEEALKSLKTLTKLDENIAEEHYFIGLILNDLGRPFEAKESLLKALDLDPCVPKYYAQMAGAYMLDADYESATMFIKEAIGMLPQEISYLRTALEIAQKKNDNDGVKFYTSQILRLEKMLRAR